MFGKQNLGMNKKQLRRKHKVKKKIPIWKNHILYTILLLITVFLFLIYSFFFNSFLSINNIIVEGSERNIQDKIENIVSENSQKLFFSFPINSIFAISPSVIKKEIKSEIIKIEEVSLKRIFPNTIKVVVQERDSVAIWCKVDRRMCYNIDKKGVVYEEVQLKGDEVVFFKSSAEDTALGENIISKDEIKVMFDISLTMKNNDEIISFFNFTNRSVLEVFMFNGWKVYFLLDNSFERQLENIDIIFKQEVKNDQRKDLDYIDMRYGDRIYYK